MKKYLNYSLAYTVFAMISRVFYREFTKWNGFSGVTSLGKVHAHLFLLGTLVFMLIALFSKDNTLEKQKYFGTFMCIYNIGLPVTAMMMSVRGVLQVLNVSLSKEIHSAISGISGIGHILVGIGLILLFISLKNSEVATHNNEK